MNDATDPGGGRPPTIEVVEVAPGAFGPATPRAPWVEHPPLRPRWGRAVLLFLLTFFTATTLGPFWTVAIRTDATTALVPFTSPETIRLVWTDPALLRLGLAFALPTLLILLCHELGHYLACRRYDIRATLPYFVPAPFALGTLGAFIRIRSPIRNKRELFDVGVAGPIAGFVALLPFLVLGLAWSTPAVVEPLTAEMLRELPPDAGAAVLLVPGRSLAISLVATAIHGPLPEGSVLDLHPFALAAWVGLLATALNLLPLGQLDGGHILYAVLGRRHRRWGLPLWTALVAAGFLFWRGWLLWALIVAVLGLRHPPLVDETVELGPGRRAVAALALLLFVLSFVPIPLREILVPM